MPTYVFRCQNCDGHFEKKRSFAEASDPADCPTCGSGETKKLLNVVSLQLGGTSKGSSAAFNGGSSVPQTGGCCGGGGCGCG